jgi:undecaprenyl-diphosphatase
MFLPSHGAPTRLTLGIAAVLGALVFATTASAVLADGPPAIDLGLLLSLRLPGQPDHLVGPRWLRIAAMDFTALGSTPVLGLLSILVVVMMGMRRRWREAALAAFGMVGGVWISQMLKHGFLRDRPDAVYRAVEAHNSSFPSGHTLLATAVFLTLAMLVARVTADRATRVFALTVAVLGAVLVGLSRIYLGVHWATDVIAGWSAGLVWAAFCGLLTMARAARPAERMA